MAPLLHLLVQLLPTTPRSYLRSHTHKVQSDFSKVYQQQQDFMSTGTDGNDYIPAEYFGSSTLSSVSWGADRVDAFGLVGNNLFHKAWTGKSWFPSNNKIEALGSGLSVAPKAVTWGPNRLDVFGLDVHNVIKHQYWDGTAWKPNVNGFENLGGECDQYWDISATTWAEGRLDVFCTSAVGDLLHQYYDGSSWRPSTGSLESLGGSLNSGPSAVSWGPNRLDIFGVGPRGSLNHLYWDGSQWSEWENFPFVENTGIRGNGLTVTAWGKNRLDIYAVAFDGKLYHKYWSGSQWSDWEVLGGDKLLGAVAATSWSADRIDIVARGGKGQNYWYKFYDGQAWRPDVTGWYNKGEDVHFSSDPAAVSWGKNRLDIFGLESSGEELLHQTWYGEGWYPGAGGWETLGNATAVAVGEGGIACEL
ncbi:hypothetical protein ACLMJK_004709 [Lecanora helva]